MALVIWVVLTPPLFGFHKGVGHLIELAPEVDVYDMGDGQLRVPCCPSSDLIYEKNYYRFTGLDIFAGWSYYRLDMVLAEN
ncbi:MAG: hypothetical protein ACXABY_31865 [Candidatus Thorarchaeota archaeon]